MKPTDDHSVRGPLSITSSIRRELTLMIFGVSMAALLLAGVLIWFTQMTSYRKRMAADHIMRTRMAASNCLGAVSFHDPADASFVLRTISARPSVAYASVSQHNGQILASYRRDGFSEPPRQISVTGQPVFTGPWLVAREEIVLDGEVIGTAFLQSDLTELTAFGREMVWIVAGSLAAVFLAASLLSMRVQRFISLPIEQLTGMVRRVSMLGDYSLRAEEDRSDEVGILARAFNEMLGEVEHRDEALREREQLTQEYLDVARVMIIALDPEGRVTLINPKGCEILGAEEADVLGKVWFESFLPVRYCDEVKEGFGRLVRDYSSDMVDYENPVLRADGQERLISWHNTVIRDDSGNLVAVLCSGEDVTERREAEARESALREQLSRAERLESLGVLAGGVAHDLNNTVGPMLALPEIIECDLESALSGDESARGEIVESLGVMKTSAERAASVVRDLVALGRRGHYELSRVDVSRMISVQESQGPCIARLRQSHPMVKIELMVPDAPLVVKGSKHHLSRVIENLVRNAVEAVEGEGQVTVTAFARDLDTELRGYVMIPPGTYAVIEVTDTGQGIRQEDLERIFEPFYTRKSKTERSGSGLGLSVVHGVVQDHGGYIDVESVVGRGTTFRLYLPLEGKDVVGDEARADQLVRGSGRILVVDDEPGQIHTAKRTLMGAGYTVDTAGEGREAVRMFAEQRPHDRGSAYDLVILDMVLEPGFDGLDVLQGIVGMYPAQRCLIVSGHAENDRTKAAVSLGAALLPKPYTVQSLTAAVSDVLSQADSLPLA